VVVRIRVIQGVSLIGEDEMNAVRIAGVVLIVAGILGLVYGSFTYTKETHQAKIGSIELSVKDRETINVPMWAGVGAIVIGGLLVLFGGKKG
jgi:TRAP-type C4-dicarboxylate transport system permease small subunit